MARPRKQVDLSMAEKLASILCTEQEIADMLEISVDTLARRIREQYNMSFAEFFKRFSARGKTSLRRLQYKSAERGNVTMQIWLGKQWLNQRDSMLEEQDQYTPIGVIYNRNSLERAKDGRTKTSNEGKPGISA